MKKISLIVVGSVLFVFGIIMSCDSKENERNIITNEIELDSNSSVYLKLSNDLEKEGEYVIESDINGITVNNVDFILNKSDFNKFRENYNLSKYDRILQVYLLSDSKLNYSNHRVNNREIERTIVYYIDDDNNPLFDVISKADMSNKAVAKKILCLEQRL